MRRRGLNVETVEERARIAALQARVEELEREIKSTPSRLCALQHHVDTAERLLLHATRSAEAREQELLGQLDQYKRDAARIAEETRKARAEAKQYAASTEVTVFEGDDLTLNERSAYASFVGWIYNTCRDPLATDGAKLGSIYQKTRAVRESLTPKR